MRWNFSKVLQFLIVFWYVNPVLWRIFLYAKWTNSWTMSCNPDHCWAIVVPFLTFFTTQCDRSNLCEMDTVGRFEILDHWSCLRMFRCVWYYLSVFIFYLGNTLSIPSFVPLLILSGFIRREILLLFVVSLSYMNEKFFVVLNTFSVVQ